jgi:hypothetical protein
MTIKVTGTCIATTATLTIGCGFKPDRVKIRNVTDVTGLEFNAKEVNGAAYGVTIATNGDQAAAASAAYGVAVYEGEGPLAAASTVKVVRDETDRKGSITSFVIDNSTNKTGHWDAACNTTYVGIGSRMVIGGKTYTVMALTSTGAAANQVTLDANPPNTTSAVTKIFNKVDFIGAAAGVPIPAGFTIGASATVNNTNTDTLQFEAEIDL